MATLPQDSTMASSRGLVCTVEENYWGTYIKAMMELTCILLPNFQVKSQSCFAFFCYKYV